MLKKWHMNQGCKQPTRLVIPLHYTPQVEIVDKEHMPLVAFALKPNLDILYTVFEIQDKLRERG